MHFGYPSPGSMIFALAAAGILSLFGKSNNRRSKATRLTSDDISKITGFGCDYTSEKDKNLDAMAKVVAQHKDCTAEIHRICVFGRRMVSTFRLLSPGHKVELRKAKELIYIYAFGKNICFFRPDKDSNIYRLFNENIPYEAYLGGRDMAFLSDDDYDSCSIIIFYKIDGIAPTKVNLL